MKLMNIVYIILYFILSFGYKRFKNMYKTDIGLDIIIMITEFTIIDLLIKNNI